LIKNINNSFNNYTYQNNFDTNQQAFNGAGILKVTEYLKFPDDQKLMCLPIWQIDKLFFKLFYYGKYV